jgi:L-fuconolactonase
MDLVVDAHQHYWEARRFDYGWNRQGLPPLDRDFLPAELEPQLKTAGVAHTILVQVLHSAHETEWMLRLADAHQTIAGVVGWVDLTRDPDVVEREVRRLRRNPRLVGIRHLVHEEPDDDWLARDDVGRGLAVLQDLDVPFDLLLRPRHLVHVPRLSEQLPRLRMVIDHIAKPEIRERRIEPWATDIKVAAENPNVWCKLSGMITEADHASWTSADLAPFVETTLDAFGPGRLMYGSDWPVCTLAGSYDRVIGALRSVLGGIDPGVETLIFGASAVGFYRPTPAEAVPSTGVSQQEAGQ